MQLRFLICFVALVCSASSSAAYDPAKQSDTPERVKSAVSLPLKPERTVEFTTTEGTWISLDVSPDGNTILFELLGELYVIPMAGGEAKPITFGMQFDSEPRYSPDGSRIVFVSDRDGAQNVWTARPDGTDAQQVTHEKQMFFVSPIFTHDAQAVIVTRKRVRFSDYELWMYYLRGGSGIQITKSLLAPTLKPDDWVHTIGAALSPDGNYLYYSKRPGFYKVDGNTYPLSQIVRRNLSTGDEEPLTDAPGSGIRPAISPDGKYLAYGTRQDAETGLRLRELATGEERWLAYPIQLDEQESLFTRDLLPGYAFTPDSKFLIISFGGKIHRLDVASGADAIVPFTAHVSREVGPKLYFRHRVEEGPVRTRIIMDPSQSLDGKRLVFSSFTHLYTMDIPGGTPKRLTKAEAREFQPVWSPDGQWIAYVTWDEHGGQIYKTRADGSGSPLQLTRAPAFYSQPAWSPDGERLVALRGSRQAHVEEFDEFLAGPTGLDLVWLPADGGDTTRIIPAAGAQHPHFANENDRVYIYGRGGLVSVRLDGKDRRTVLKVSGKGFSFENPTLPEAPADDVRISPDSNWALARVDYQLYLIAVPRLGGDGPPVNVWEPSVPVAELSRFGADYMSWAGNGKVITWAVGASFFRMPANRAFEASATRIPGVQNPIRSQFGTDEYRNVSKRSLAEEISVQLEESRHKPSGTIVMSGARLVTMRGDELVENGDVIVKDNRISAVGRHGSVPIPEGAKILDVSGSTVIPGFIDTHPHWLEIRRGVLDMGNWDFLASLAYGVTTGRDPQTNTNDMFAYQDLVDIGEMPGPRAYSTGPGITADTDFRSPEDAKDIVTKYKNYYRTDYVKSYVLGNRQQRQWMVMASKALEVMPTTEGAIDTGLDLTHIIDGFSGNEHSMPTIPMNDDVVQLIARTGIFFTPTLIISFGAPFAENFFFETTEVHDDPKVRRFVPHNLLDSRTRRRTWYRKDEYKFSLQAVSDRKIVEAGGKVCVGSHGELQGIGYHWEMWAIASGGMKPIDVLRSATLTGAEALGLDQDLGSVEAGKLADLIILNKNPLEDIHNTTAIRYIMKNGELFDGNTLDQVWPVQKPLSPLWWWNEKP
jgi:Tol biopolymer transport system component/imidazolonepropionase-like amidohydrolase